MNNCGRWFCFLWLKKIKPEERIHKNNFLIPLEILLNWLVCVVDYFFVSPLQAGLYRLSGADRTVKELKEKFLRSKTVPVLSKVDDIHAITGLLKDFLRNLKEPLLTFHLNRAFMDAAGISARASSGYTLIRNQVYYLKTYLKKICSVKI